MTSTLSCSICFNAYEDREDGRRPCIGTCGHTLCLSCKSMMPNSTCPFCKADEAFAVTTFNYVLLELIAQQKQNRASVSGTSLCPSCQTPSQRLRLCDDCGVKEGYLEYTSDKHVRIRWLEKDDIVSKENLTKAKSVAKCANCILDDETHIGHKTIDFGALEEEFNFMIQQRENSRLHIETLDALQSELHQVKDLIKGDSANLENTFRQFGIRDTKPQTQFIENCRHKYRTISAEFDLLRKSFHRLSNMLSDGGAQTPMEVDTKTISSPPQPSTASGAFPTSTPGRVEFSATAATSTFTSSHKDQKPFSPDSKLSHSSTTSIASPAASMATASPSPSILSSQQSTATFHSAGPVSTVSSPSISQADSSSSLTQMEIDHTIPSTSGTPPILFDYKRLPMTFESKVVIADRKQNKPTDPLLVGVFDIATESYKTIGKLQTMRANYALARKDSLLFIVGGMHGGNWLALVEVYDREKNYRREVARLITARTRCSALVYNNKLYVAGGYSGIYMKSVEVWDFTGGWKETKPLNYARADAVLIEYGGKMFAMGGYNGKEYEERIEVYDEAKNMWTEYGYMRGSRAGFAATVFDKRIYIAGGWSSSNNTLKTMKSWSPESKEWREEPSMNLPRKYLTLATVTTKDEEHLHILALRGNAENWDLVQVNEKFEPKTQSPKWHPLGQRT